MKSQFSFRRILVIFFVSLFLVGGVFYSGTFGIFPGGIAFCQEDDGEEPVQARPRPYTRPNPMMQGQSVMDDGQHGDAKVSTQPAGQTQQMRRGGAMHQRKLRRGGAIQQRKMGQGAFKGR